MSAKLLTASEVKRAALVSSIESMLTMCNDDARDFLDKIHSHAPWKTWRNAPDRDLESTHDLVLRSVRK